MTKKELINKSAGRGAFDRAVWLACLEIPRGQTRTYKWLAEKIGRPQAARAVAQALARNPFAPDVPCHRVVRSDGLPGGYSGPGGAAGKVRLLEDERRGGPRRPPRKAEGPA
jgi:methylated-DNA-[protein]-cysteine S-methyltransferase